MKDVPDRSGQEVHGQHRGQGLSDVLCLVGPGRVLGQARPGQARRMPVAQALPPGAPQSCPRSGCGLRVDSLGGMSLPCRLHWGQEHLPVKALCFSSVMLAVGLL